jgi:hypothetical protein
LQEQRRLLEHWQLHQWQYPQHRRHRVLDDVDVGVA